MLRKNRITAVSVNGGTANELTGSVTATPGVVADGGFVVLGSTISITGAVVGDPVFVGVSVSLAAGIFAIGKVTAANVVTIEIYNQTGESQALGSHIFNATVLA